MLKKLLLPALVAVSLQAHAATAVDYPNRPVRVVVAFSAGGAADAAMRIVGERLSAKWKQPVIIDNRPGAAGAIATEIVVKSKPDGYTALVNVSTIVVNEITNPSVPYRLFSDLVAVTTLFTTPVLFVVGSGVHADNLKSALREAKGTPNFSYGHHGDLTSTHLWGERLNKLSGLNMVAVPYNGDAPMATHLLGGHLTAGFISGATAKKLEETGKVKVLAQSFKKRSPLFPNVPTFAELGYKDMDRGTWGRVFMATGTSPEIAAKFAADVNEVLATKEVQERFAALSLDPGGGTPQETLRDLQSDYAYWSARVKEVAK